MASFPAVDTVPTAYAYGSEAILSDMVASEICSALESINGSLPVQFSELQYGMLDEPNSPVVALYYQRMALSVLPQRQIFGLSGQIRAGSGAALTSSAQAASALEIQPEYSVLLSAIRDRFRATDANSIAALGMAAVDATKPPAFRTAVAHALAAIHTVGTLPYLATLLSDNDPALQIEAIGGLGSFANGLAMQTMAGNSRLAHLQLPATAPYRTRETIANFAMGPQAIQNDQTTHLAFWKQWWAQQRGDLGF